MKKEQQESGMMDNIKPSSKSLYILVSLLIVWIIGWILFVLNPFGFDFSHQNTISDQINALDLSNGKEKIPYNTKTLTVNLGAPIDPTSITQKTVTISPFIDGQPSVSSDKKTITYSLLAPLEVGELYELRVASEVKKSDGTPLGKDKVMTYEAISSAQAMRIFPIGSLDNLSQNITVVFNTPMVPLTNLDERDKLPCPLTITPKIEWRCVWTNTSLLEFVPENYFEWATRYNVQVSDVPWLLHTLSWTLTGEIMTTPLQVYVSWEFSPLKPIHLWVNFPVSVENLNTSLEFYSGTVYWSGSQENKIEVVASPVLDENRKPSETDFMISPKSTSFTYKTNYTVIVRTSLKPKYGTEPLKNDSNFRIRTNNFIHSLQPSQTLLDASWAAIDTEAFPWNTQNMILPNERLFFLATLDDEVPLDTSLLVLRSKEDGSSVLFDLSYGKYHEYDNKWNITKTLDNKKQLKIVPKVSLKKNAPYELVFLKKSNAAMLSDEVYSFRTAPDLIVSDFKALSNTEGCIYTNNKVEENYGYNEYGDAENNIPSKPRITTTPSSRTPSLRFDYEQYVWNDSWSSYTKKYTCPQIVWKHAYVVDLRLNPNLAYKIDFQQALKDEYNQQLPKVTSFSLKSGPTAEKDKFLYSSLEWSQTQVIPSNLPIVLGLLSVNTDEADIDVCEFDQDGYISMLNRWRRWAIEYPDCKKRTQKKVVLKNRFWTSTPSKFDIENDILEHSFSTPFLFVRGSIGVFSEKNYQKKFSHIFIRSNLSLTFEDAKNQRLLFASSHDGKSLPSNLTFDAYKWVYDDTGKGSYEKIKKFPIAWDAKKQVYKITNPDVEFDLLIAKNDKYLWVLNLNQDQTSNYDFKYISGMDASTRDYLYIYPDRPLYKLSDTVYFKWVLRSFHFDGYHPSEAKKWKIKVIWGQWTVSWESVIAEMEVTVDENSNFHWQFTLPDTAPLGRYAFEFYGSGSDWPMTQIYNNGEFFIEAYKKPVFKVSVETPKPDAMIGESVDIKGHAEYYFGWALGMAPYQYSVLSQSYYFDPKEYRNYRFSEGSAYMDCLYWGSCEFNDSMESNGTGILDAKGDGSFRYEYRIWDTAWEKIYTYSLEVTDPDTQKTVNQSVSQILHTTDAYVGVDVPYWNSTKKWVKLDGIVLDYHAKWLAWKTVWLVLIKRDWKNVKKEWVDGVFYNEWSIEETTISKQSVISDSEWRIAYTFLSATGGEYEIRATYTGTNNVGFTSSVFTYVSGGEYESYWYEWNNTVADLTADTTILSVGDKAGFTLKTPIKSGKMLVTIEKDDGILDYYLQDITSTTSRIEFPVLDAYIPNVYVKVFAVGQNPWENLPIYKRALSVIKVLSDPKKLSVIVQADKKQYLPGEAVKLSVTVQDAKGNGVAWANGSVSIVDESLLALAWNPQKNPFVYFYDMKRYLGVETYTSLLNLIQKLEVKDTSLGEKWWAGEWQKWWLSKKKRWVFKDTAFWQADFKTDANGNYSFTTPVLPDNLTTWVIEALINTKKTEVWVGSTHIQTTKKVVINDNLPRFLGTSDAVTLAPVIFNKTDVDSVFDITLEANNVTINTPKQSVMIKSWEQVSVDFEVVVDGIDKIRKLTPQATKITMKAVSQATKEQDSLEMTLPIIETTTREMVVTSGRSNTTRDEQIEIESAIRSNGGFIDIRYAATLLPGLLSGLDFLASYPYGCLEQKLAAIMPQVYIKELYDSIDVPYDLSKLMVSKYISKEEGYQEVSLKDAIQEVLASVSSYQRYEGGFGYWHDSWYSDLWLTLSTVSRLRSLSNIGFATSSDVLSRANQYIKSTFYFNIRPFCYTSPCGYSVSERVEMIRWVLASNPSDYEAYKMYQIVLREIEKNNAETNKDTTTGIYAYGVDWSLSYARLLLELSSLTEVNDAEKMKLKSEAQDIIRKVGNENIVNNPRGSFIGRSGAYSRLSNTLGFIETVTLLGGETLREHQTVIDQMTRWVMDQKSKDGSWGSTYDTVSVIKSITATEKLTWELRNVDLASTLSLDGTVLESQTVNSKNKLEVFTKSLTLDALKDTSLLRFEKTGTGKVYYDIALEYALKASWLKPRDEGFAIESVYYDYDAYKAIEKLKREEWEKYMQNEIIYTELKYPKETFSYLEPLTTLNVGQLVLVHNRMILAEPRDQVAFEGFVPAGSELVNPNLKTESQDVGWKSSNTLFEHEEWQDDRYFATVSSLDAGIYGFDYIFRPTHAGTYELRPSRVSEFYHPEIFGRTAWSSLNIKKNE